MRPELLHSLFEDNIVKVNVKVGPVAPAKKPDYFQLDDPMVSNTAIVGLRHGRRHYILNSAITGVDNIKRKPATTDT